MEYETITPAVIAAGILSVMLEWFPGVASWFEALTPAKKVTVNALLIAVISAVTVLGQCYLWGDTCPENIWSTAGEILIALLLAAAGNQAIHAMTRREVWAS